MSILSRYLFWIIFFIVIFGLHFIGFLIARKKWTSMQSVQATITKSKLSNYSALSDNGLKRVFNAEIEFKYRFNGVEYSSSTPALKPPQLFTLHDFEADLVDEYKEGETYEARINPKNPAQAHLTISPIDKTALYLIAGVLIVIPLAWYGITEFLTWYDPGTGPGDWWYRP